MTGTLGGTVVMGKPDYLCICHGLYRSHAINEVTKKKKGGLPQYRSHAINEVTKKGELPQSRQVEASAR